MNERGVDETLRMIARMPAPDGLEERLKAETSVGRSGAWARAGMAGGAVDLRRAYGARIVGSDPGGRAARQQRRLR